MNNTLDEAISLFEQCARQLMRTGGMVNKDLAKEVTRFASRSQLADLEKDAARYRTLIATLPAGTFGDHEVSDKASWDAAVDEATQSSFIGTDPRSLVVHAPMVIRSSKLVTATDGNAS